MLLYLELTIVLGAVLLTALLSRRTGLPLTVLEILVGVVIVATLGFRMPADAAVLVTFGSLLIVFLAGLETRFDFLRENFRAAVLVGIPGFAVPCLALFLFLRLEVGAPLLVSLVGASALADTSISIVYTTLHQYDLARLPFGRMVLAATLMVNLAEDTTITSMTLLSSGLLLLSLVAVVALGLAALLLPRFIDRMRSVHADAFPNVPARSLMLSLGVLALFSSVAAIPGILFVFVLGLLASRGFSSAALEEVQRFAFALFVPFYFVNVGLNVDLGFVLAHLPLLLGLVAIASVAKLAALWPGLLAVFGARRAPPAAVLMNTRLTSATVILLLMLEAGTIDTGWYSLFISSVVILALGSSGALRDFHAFESPEEARKSLSAYPSGATVSS